MLGKPVYAQAAQPFQHYNRKTLKVFMAIFPWGMVVIVNKQQQTIIRVEHRLNK
jgi:hypothetical protein